MIIVTIINEVKQVNPRINIGLSEFPEGANSREQSS